jgi:mRNA interferase HigB
MQRHATARAPLSDWVIRIRAARVSNFHELKRLFGSADIAFGWTIFDIGGNNYRLIADVDYRMGRVYIKAFLTHAEYDTWNKHMRQGGD